MVSLAGESCSATALLDNNRTIGTLLWSLALLGGLSADEFVAAGTPLAWTLPETRMLAAAQPHLRSGVAEAMEQALTQVATAWLTLQVQGTAQAVVRARSIARIMKDTLVAYLAQDSIDPVSQPAHYHIRNASHFQRSMCYSFVS